MVNAKRFLGHRTPEPSSAEWKALEVMSGCDCGDDVLSTQGAASRLGLKMRLIKLSPGESLRAALAHAPASLTLANPEKAGGAFHNVLLIGGDTQRARLVNYRWQNGPVVESVPWAEIDMPKNFAVVALRDMEPGDVDWFKVVESLPPEAAKPMRRSLRKRGLWW